MGSSLRARINSVWLVVVVASLITLVGVRRSCAQSLYNITFSQFTAGTIYTNASGPPNDFSSYIASGSNSVGVSSFIVQAYSPGLANKPLACNNAGQGVGNFLMQMGNVSSNV